MNNRNDVFKKDHEAKASPLNEDPVNLLPSIAPSKRQRIPTQKVLESKGKE